MDIMRTLFGNTRDENDYTEEELAELAAEEKAERIRFHREKVRNGPIKFNYLTVGQQRRAEVRRKKAQSRKANTRHRKAWMAARRQHAVLRGQLQAVGVLPGSAGVPAPTSPETSAVLGQLLEHQYGSVEQALGAYQRAEAQYRAEELKVKQDEAMRKLLADGSLKKDS